MLLQPPLKEVILKRINDNGIQTLGILYYNNIEIAKTLELPWKGNQFRISCIPKGTYKVIRRHSAKYGEHFHILDVSNRTYILIHHGNYYYNFLGCIGVGQSFKDINNDGQLDITNSKNTMKKLLKTLPKEFTLKII